VYITLESMYVTVCISTGLYPNLDLQNANKLHYITLKCLLILGFCRDSVVIVIVFLFDGVVSMSCIASVRNNMLPPPSQFT